ncbi:MAG: family 43 glycosylhydrolase [Thermoguttaceae bacterium]|nr:family 43 glycosylhydrolase [Thermoguttaceae bacterium]
MRYLTFMIFMFSAGFLCAGEVPCVFPTSEEVRSITPADFPPLAEPSMKWGGPENYAKDPSVIRFQGKYWLYFSRRPLEGYEPKRGWITGVAQSSDLVNWELVRYIQPLQESEWEVTAPCVKVVGEQVVMFYQTWSPGKKHALCIAVSKDGLHFTPHPENPIFRPNAEWGLKRAIDADFIETADGRRFLYGVTREKTGKIQQVIVAEGTPGVELMEAKWTQSCTASILKPELPWETRCIEAPSVIERSGKLYMFYAGGYNNDPQQIGVAVSTDGIQWTRLWSVPFIPNGPEGQWNASETGHPGVFQDEDGQTWLFVQGNRTHGKDWFISRVKIGWRPGKDGIEIPFVELEEK